jgi:DNA polymerase III epsilon subunit-like protein
MINTFTAIDFETANYQRTSICQIGLVRFENGIITKEYSTLIQPPGNSYIHFFINFHGISPEMTKDAPKFYNIWDDIKEYIENQTVVAHNGFSFDFVCLEKTLNLYDIEIPEFEKVCTYQIYKSKLNLLCELYSINLQHHDALSDAKACGLLYLIHLNNGDGVKELIESCYSFNAEELNKEKNIITREISRIADKSMLNEIESLTLTDEQKSIIKSIKTYKKLKILAYAGTGKTTTLKFITQKYDQYKFLYIAFNKSIVEEARKNFSFNVDCLTTHSLAYSFIGKSINRKKTHNSITGPLIVSHFNIKDCNIGKNQFIRRYQIGDILYEIIENFCNSDSFEISKDHFPIDEIEGKPELEYYVDFFIEIAKKIWNYATNNNNDFPLGFLGFFKLWQLSKPQISSYDFILLDEAQDTNDCMIDVLNRQKCNIVYVGDSYQGIYEWRGAISSLDKISSDFTEYLTNSFRFNQSIADFANNILKLFGEKKLIKGIGKTIDSNDSVVLQKKSNLVPNAILCKTNLSVIIHFIDTITILKLKASIVGGTKEIIDYITDAKRIIEENKHGVSRFFIGINNRSELHEYLNTVHKKREIERFYKIIRIPDIIDILKSSEKYQFDYDLEISTIWKVKGREWNVVLLDDLLSSGCLDAQKGAFKIKNINMEWLKILYVACTRAKLQLILSYEDTYKDLENIQISSMVNNRKDINRIPVIDKFNEQLLEKKNDFKETLNKSIDFSLSIYKWWEDLSITWKNIFLNAVQRNQLNERSKPIMNLEKIDNDLYERIKNLSKIEYVLQYDYSFKKLTNIDALTNLINLDELILYGNEIENIYPLKNITVLKYLENLEILNLAGNKINNISCLENLKNINDLNLSENEISDLTSISRLNEITSLNLSHNNIIDITPLEKLIKLTKLSLKYNSVIDIEPLKNIDNLKHLDLRFCQVDQFQLNSLQNKFPNATIKA